MSQFCVLIVIFFCFFFHVKAQETSNSEPDSLHPLHPNIAVVIGVLSIAFSLLFIVLAYAKLCQSNHSNFADGDPHHRNLQELVRSRSRFSGIDKAVIESLPLFRFASLRGSKEGLECAWLEGHASCPLCRYKFDVIDLGSFSYSNSLRFLRIPSNLTEEPNLEIFVQREQSHQGSSRFNLRSSFRKIEQNKKQEELLIEGGNRSYGDQKLLHKFKHKIIVADVVIKNRWSDVNSSDLLSLNSEMLSVMSINRFLPSNSKSGRFDNGFSVNDNMVKIKEDIERKRLYESRFSGIEKSHSVSGSSISSSYYNDENSSKLLNGTEKRSMSEITNFSRFREFNVSKKIRETSAGDESRKEERLRRVWLPMVQRTISSPELSSTFPVGNWIQFDLAEREHSVFEMD
ncbi:hypothetical protein WN944_000461 [Citrus x changshan-huyou]|uniref:RING-type E3 ubiquitin transferase n=1 Tax=Citrus x changshan-huyou TaxID=2935761 RepID=A0AAP0QPR3_9ROSI